MKENALFSFIWTGLVVLIAPDSALVGFRPTEEKICQSSILGMKRAQKISSYAAMEMSVDK